MIELKIATDGNEVLTHFDENEVTYKEVSLMIAELERVKLELLGKHFEPKFEVSSDNGEDKE